MYITVRTIITEDEKINTAVKYYYDYEVAKINLITQRDLLILELLIKYTHDSKNLCEFMDSIYEYGKFTFEDDVLEFIDNFGDYHVRYEILKPENYKNDYFYNMA